MHKSNLIRPWLVGRKAGAVMVCARHHMKYELEKKKKKWQVEKWPAYRLAFSRIPAFAWHGRALWALELKNCFRAAHNCFVQDLIKYYTKWEKYLFVHSLCNILSYHT